MPLGTPKLERIKAAVSAAFPDAIYGQANCRPRNGLGWWSQHAGSEDRPEPEDDWKGNAVDIVHKDYGYGNTSPAHQAWLDRVNAYLVANREALDLNELIWRKRNHYDHIHTSPWPKMHDPPWYTPPCKGGDLIVVYADKTRGDTFAVASIDPDMATWLTALQRQTPAYFERMQETTDHPGGRAGYWGESHDEDGNRIAPLPSDEEWDKALDELAGGALEMGSVPGGLHGHTSKTID